MKLSTKGRYAMVALADLAIVSVGTLEDAIASLDLLNDPANEHLVKGCA